MAFCGFVARFWCHERCICNYLQVMHMSVEMASQQFLEKNKPQPQAGEWWSRENIDSILSIVSWIPHIYIPTIWWCQIYPVMSHSRNPSCQTNPKHTHTHTAAWCIYSPQRMFIYGPISRRHVYITPTSYLELLSSFISVLAMKRKQAWKYAVVTPMSELSCQFCVLLRVLVLGQICHMMSCGTCPLGFDIWSIWM